MKQEVDSKDRAMHIKMSDLWYFRDDESGHGLMVTSRVVSSEIFGNFRKFPQNFSGIFPEKYRYFSGIIPRKISGNLWYKISIRHCCSIV